MGSLNGSMYLNGDNFRPRLTGKSDGVPDPKGKRDSTTVFTAKKTRAASRCSGLLAQRSSTFEASSGRKALQSLSNGEQQGSMACEDHGDKRDSEEPFAPMLFSRLQDYLGCREDEDGVDKGGVDKGGVDEALREAILNELEENGDQEKLEEAFAGIENENKKVVGYFELLQNSDGITEEQKVECMEDIAIYAEMFLADGREKDSDMDEVDIDSASQEAHLQFCKGVGLAPLSDELVVGLPVKPSVGRRGILGSAFEKVSSFLAFMKGLLGGSVSQQAAKEGVAAPGESFTEDLDREFDKWLENHV